VTHPAAREGHPPARHGYAARVPPASDAHVASAVAVPYQRPWLPPAERILAHYRRAEEARFYSNGGPCARTLESRLSERLDGAHCVLMANCTLAIAIALQVALERPERSRRLVATPAYTFTATACAIRWAGYEPLFVDVEPEGWQLDPAALDAALGARSGEVAGVLGCSTFGTPAAAAATAAWAATAAEHGVPLVLDSAAAFGAHADDGAAAGARGRTELFSFHATKPFAIGEGGLLATPDPVLAERARRLMNFGLEPATGTSTETGVNAKLSELAAATGLAMLEAFDEQLARRRANAEALRAALSDLPLGWQRGAEESTWQVVPVLAPAAAGRDEVCRSAVAGGVMVRTPFDPPLHRHPAFADAPRHGTLAVSEDLAARTVALPMANDLETEELELVATAVRKAL
jgi:dTDP-4-amino-4,6-dideoxygalactose transaminase